MTQSSFEEGCRLFTAGCFVDAELVFRSLASASPQDPDVINALGSAVDAAGRPEEALPLLREACRLRPASAPFHYNLGNVLRTRGDREAAEAEYLEAVRHDPNLAQAFHGLGSLYLEDGKLEPAEACLQRAVALAGDFAPALNDLGQLRQLQKTQEEAENLYRQAIAADPGFLPALNALGMLLLRSSRPEDARTCFQTALAANFNYLQARCNLAVLDTWCGRVDRAIEELRAVSKLAPDDGDIHYNLALALLSAGRMDEGWREYEWRFRKANPVPQRHGGIPRWQGEPLAGKRILIHAEQGYGDSLQFIRYAPLLAAEGATVLVEAQDRAIAPILATAKGVAQVIVREAAVPPVDLQLPMMSLPFLLGKRGCPPPPCPYLHPHLDKVLLWNKRLEPLPGLKVGLAWAGRPEHENDANRSLPGDAVAALAAVPGCSPVSLQFGPAASGGTVPALHNFTSDVHDFSDSAALIANLDLVITVDSAVAHAAGALGIRGWVLLPWNSDWRWMRNRTDTPWYGRTTLYRQLVPGGWGEVVDRVARDLSQLIPLFRET